MKYIVTAKDASGRLPTLILKRFIDERYKINNHSAIPTRFVAGFYKQKGQVYPWMKSPEEMFQSKIKGLSDFDQYSGKRALVVTEHINTGGAMEEMKRFLDSYGIVSEIVAVSAHPNFSKDEDKSEQVVLGKSSTQPSITWRSDLSGVKKYSDQPYSERDKDFENQSSSREDVNIIADRLIKWYENLKPTEV